MSKLLVFGLSAAAMVAGLAERASQAGLSGPAIFSSAQAAAGAKIYAAQCSRCHGVKLEGVSAPALSGSGSGLAGDSVAEAYVFIATQMPAGNPGSLSSAEYINVMAFLLNRNGHAPGGQNLTLSVVKSSPLKI